MTYALLIDAIQVGPFTTHIAATVFAEQNGFDDYTMVELYDPAEAPGLIRRLNPCQRNSSAIYRLRNDHVLRLA
jgi:hypothetical protein